MLKGPQGTLYGRNTTGGAIKITTQLPDYSGVNGEAKVGYGRSNAQTVSGTVNLPIVDNRVALNLGGQYSKDDGYGRDLSNGADLQNMKSEAFRGALRLDHVAARRSLRVPKAVLARKPRPASNLQTGWQILFKQTPIGTPATNG